MPFRSQPFVLQAETVSVVHIDNNEAAFSVAIVPFAVKNNELHLVVGTSQDTFLAPRSCTSGFLRTYRFTDDGRGLELLHKVSVCASSCTDQHLISTQTETNDVPLAIMAFQGKLIAGVGKSLRLYDMGKKKLLRKVENKVSLGRPPLKYYYLIVLYFRLSAPPS